MTEYQRALEALQAAHDACYKHEDRDILGMSHGPFSGVNVALGIIACLELENIRLTQLIRSLRPKKEENMNEFTPEITTNVDLANMVEIVDADGNPTGQYRPRTSEDAPAEGTLYTTAEDSEHTVN